MEFFVYGRDKPGVGALKWELAEAHWAFIDHYTEALIARGPTLANGDGQSVTGSVHLVDLPDATAAQAFAFDEPYYQAGIFHELLIRRWRNVLGRTMWDFVGTGHPQFLIICHRSHGGSPRRAELPEEQLRYLNSGPLHNGMIAYGPLLSDDGIGWLGEIMLVEGPSLAAVEAIVAGSPYAQAKLYHNVEIHSWRFGGRPSSEAMN